LSGQETTFGSIIVADPRICRCEKYLLSEDNGFFGEAFANEREIVREPGVDSAFEWANPGDSFGSQQQRYTGAGRFVGSRTVENDVAIPGNLRSALRSLPWLYLDIHGLAQVHD
jgi:hypothetical protein